MRPLLLIPLLVAGCLGAQQSSAAGVTVDQTGQPLAGVHVRLITGDFDSGEGAETVYGATSDKSGQFSFPSVKPGLYLVMAERTGFIQQGSMGFAMLALKPGQQLTDHKIAMTAQAVIAGRVTDEYGDPVQGFPVQTQAVVSNQLFTVGGRNVMTDDRGEFRLITAPGKYYVKAAQFNQNSGAQEVRTDGTAGRPFISTYFPSAADTGAASAIEVAAGQDLAGIEIRLLRTGPSAPTHSFTISGIVMGTPDNGRANVMLRFGENAGGMYNGRGTSADADGKFSFTGMQPGFYSVAASYNSGKTALQSHALRFRIEAADETGLQLSLAPGEDLIGKLELAGDSSPGQAEKFTVRLEASGWGNQYAQGDPAAAEVGQDGSFHIAAVPPARFKPVVEPMPENGYLKEVAMDGKTAPDGVLDFSQGVGGSRLKITVSRNGGRISGKVLGKDGEPAIGLIMIFLGTDTKHMEEDNAARTSDGNYSFKGIHPGKYRLLAVDVAEMMQAFSGDGNNDETMKQLFDAGEENRRSKRATAFPKTLRRLPKCRRRRRSRRMFTRWLAMLPAAAAVLAQTAPEPASISGAVTNSVTGEPVVRAHVMARCTSEDSRDGQREGQQTFGALTNEKGAFSIAPLPPGNCSMDVQRVGFVAPFRRESYALSSGTHKEDLKLTLIPAGVIMGRVLSSAGEPALGINVSAELANGNSGNTTTDDRGQFRIGGLRPGKYRVKATPQSMPLPPEIRADGTTELRDAATYYPDSLSAKMAQRLDVKPGAEMSSVEIKLVQTPIVQVSGKVTGVPLPVKDANINIQPSGQGGGIKPDGTFSLWRLDPGKYTLQAQHWAGQLQLQSAPLDIEVASVNLEHLELRMVPPFEIAGQLRFDDDQAGEPVKPPVRRDGSSPQAPPPQPRAVQLHALADRNIGNTIVASDDTFTLEKVQPGRYRVTVGGVSGYVKSLRMGETESQGDVLDVRNGGAGPLTVTLSSNFCEISGMVSDAKGPVADAAIVLARSEDRTNPRIERSKSDGTYKFRVPPGKYKLAAVDEEAMSWGFQGPDQEDYETEAIELSAGDKIAKDLVQRE